jgi:uncharacterized tellurite resistance protein B-like protein
MRRVAPSSPKREAFAVFALLSLLTLEIERRAAVYLNLLDDDEKRAFAELAEKMIEADGLVIGREASALAALKAEMGVSETGGGGRTADELAGVFKNRRSKIVALLELIGLGYSDTAFSVSEESLVNTVANQMAISPDDLHQIEEWVQEHFSLVRRALILMRE